MNKNLFTLTFLSILMVFIAFSVGCKKDHSPKATVTVYLEDENGVAAPIEGATVTIYVDPTMFDTTHANVDPYIDAHQDSLIKEDVQITDQYGQTHHTFHYESILHVEAKYGFKKNDTIYGFGALVLKEDETYEETVILKR